MTAALPKVRNWEGIRKLGVRRPNGRILGFLWRWRSQRRPKAEAQGSGVRAQRQGRWQCQWALMEADARVGGAAREERALPRSQKPQIIAGSENENVQTLRVARLLILLAVIIRVSAGRQDLRCSVAARGVAGAAGCLELNRRVFSVFFVPR